MSLYEKLKNKYYEKTVKTYGTGIIVPFNELDLEQQKAIEKEGNLLNIVQDEGVTVWMVRPKPTPQPPHLPVPPKPKPEEQTIPKSRSEASKQIDWEPEDIQRLEKRWKELSEQGPTCAYKIAEKLILEFPGRTKQAIYVKHYMLNKNKTHQEQPKELVSAKDYVEKVLLKPEQQPTNEKKKQYLPIDPMQLFHELIDVFTELNKRLDQIEKNQALFAKEIRINKHIKETGEAAITLNDN